MISRDLTLRISNNKASLSEPVTVYMYDRGILLNIKVLEYKYKTGSMEQDNFIQTHDGIVAASALIKSPSGKVFKYPEVKAMIEDDTVKVLITKDWTDEVDDCGDYKLQIQLYDLDSSRVSLPPFSIRIEPLIAPYDDGNEGDTSDIVDVSKFDLTYIGYDAEVTDNSNIEHGYYDKTEWSKGMLISSSHFNKIEDKISKMYAGEGISKTNIKYLNTKNKTTVSAINELNEIYLELKNKIDKLIQGIMLPDISGINIIEEELDVSVGVTYSLDYEIEPPEADRTSIIFESSDETVCTVNDNGVISPIGIGECVITCRSINNSEIHDTINIMSYPKIIPIESIHLEYDEMAFNPNDTTYKMNYEISPSDTIQTKVNWSTSNKRVCTVDSEGRITKVLSEGNLIGPEVNVPLDDNILAACNIMCSSKITPSVNDYCRVIFYKMYLQSNIPDNLNVGDVIRITLLKDNSFTEETEYVLSNPNMASIDNDGYMTILSSGTCDVYVQSSSGIISNRITVTVS